MNDREDMALHPSDDGWIEWKGGECPVPVDTLVKLRTRCGYETEVHQAGEKHLQKFWKHERRRADLGLPGIGESDIIAYRIVEPSHD